MGPDTTAARKPVARRMATPGSATWHAMLDGAEVILREEGYAALTSRAVAERVGVKQRLVYYYFETMDDLVIETFRRLAARELDRLRAARDGERPLRELWDACIHTADARLISEFIALANRNPGLKAEVVAYIRGSRAIQVEALEAALDRMPGRSTVAPAGLALLATSLALALTREAGLGVDEGHEDLLAAVGAFLDSAEPSADL